MKYVLFIFMFSILSGCAYFNPVERFSKQTLDRAAFEMGCDKDKLQVTKLGDGCFGVEGCGKKNVYIWVYGSGYVNNSAIREKD